jgi:AcrR family transcriptional regulator
MYRCLQQRYVRTVTGAQGLRERKSARTRDAILRAALELTLEKGFAETTVDEIAARADVSPRTVYTRFPTKDSIIFGPLDQSSASFDAWLARFLEWFDHAEGGLVDRLLAYVRDNAEAARAAGELEQLKRRAMIVDPYLRRVMRGRYEALERAIALQVAQEIPISADDSGARVFAASAVALLLIIAEQSLDDPEGFDPNEHCALGVAVLRSGLESLRRAPA